MQGQPRLALWRLRARTRQFLSPRRRPMLTGSRRIKTSRDLLCFARRRLSRHGSSQGQRFEFGLVLIGRALDFLPYFVLSFRELAAEGLGLNRAKCNLERVEQIKLPLDGAGPQDCQTEVIYTAEDQLFRATESLEADEWIKSRLQECLPASVAPDPRRHLLAARTYDANSHSRGSHSISDAHIPARGWGGHPPPRVSPRVQAPPRPHQRPEHVLRRRPAGRRFSRIGKARRESANRLLRREMD